MRAPEVRDGSRVVVEVAEIEEPCLLFEEACMTDKDKGGTEFL